MLVAKRSSLFFISCVVALSLAACGGGGGVSYGSGSSGGTSTATITGTARTTAAAKPGQNGGGRQHAPMASAAVTMWKIYPDGTAAQVNTGTVTTDSTGAFSITGVTLPTTGTGAATDYYYEVRVTDGANTVKYPLAPTGNMTITATPDTTLAATILNGVVNNPVSATNPTPSAATINQAAALVTNNVTDLAGKTTLPGATGTSAEVLAAANGVASAGGNAEAEYKALQFGSEYAGFKADLAAADSTAVSGYLMRISKESCGTANNPITILAADALAAALKAGTTYTATEVLNAYNAVANPQAAASRIADYGTTVSGIDTATTLTDLQLTALLTRRTLTAVDASTALAPDQALSLLLYLGSASGNLCQTNALQTAQMVASLTASALFAGPAIMNYEIYNTATGGCGTPNTTFAADDVQIFIPKTSTLSATGVTVSATGFNGNAPYALALENDRYRTTGTSPVVCVTAGTTLNYTITATLSDASTLTKAVTRQHNAVPEPSVLQMNGGNVSQDQAAPTLSVDKRPIFTWTPAADLYTQITSPPAGSQVKYTYEFAHYVKNSGGPINPPTTACPGANTGGARKLYTVDNFIPASDCQPTTCAAAQGVAATEVECRMYINAWLVDQNDKLLGQAAGTFRYFCPDTNGDGQCD